MPEGICLNVCVSGRSSLTLPSLVCLHFWGGSPELFQPLMDQLPDLHIVAPAFRQSLPDGAQSGYIEILVADVVGLLRSRRLHEGAGYVLLGHSMGGKVAQALAARRPPGLRGLILVAPAPLSPLILPDDIAEQQAHAYDDAESAGHVIRTVLLGHRDSVTSDMLERLTWSCVTSGRAWPTLGMKEDLGDLAGDVRCPVLAVVGEMDRVEPETRVRAEVLERLTRVEIKEVVRLQNVGHLIPVEAPDALATASRRFLQSL
ncbi:alpha/beta-hydrolase [Exidia glandulosa HHB12029]|uniref:Alpha/beta-hydrolase n=1 Tax=Exidia glandulosa HHB12029 TaxID=1314781 RepID=A0A165IGC6_EXIGL|nr:alpha/beta-hydrolase [Exidia glandulosa HHB12029]